MMTANLLLSFLLLKLTCKHLLRWNTFLTDLRLFSSDKYEEQRRVWGGGIRGNKSADMLRKRAKAAGQTLSVAAAKKL
jgi:large subunit ribosomal protein L7Ae